MKRLTFALTLLLTFFTTALHAVEPSLGLELKGGAFFNEKLRSGSSGREHQMKLTDAIITLKAENQQYGALIEASLTNDQIEVKQGDITKKDIYRNSGTSIYYYGNSQLREAKVFYKHSQSTTSYFGRMTTYVDPVFEFAPYAPHAVIYNSGIFNGYRISYVDGFTASLSVLWGRDRPCLSGNCYLNGTLDPQEKGNNTPVVEGYVGYDFGRLNIYGWLLVNKTGSAPGSFNSGKHNDRRAAIGGSVDLYDGGVSLSMDFQYVDYLVGLTENGVQGERSGVQSYDIQRSGWWVSPVLSYGQTSLRVTYEELDRADAIAYQEVAKFDRNHPVMSQKENRWIASLTHRVDSNLELGLHYTVEEVPNYPAVGDEFGATFSFKW